MIFLITAPSGAGKTTLMQALKENPNISIDECVSHTTRPMRDGEVEGETYYYVDEKEFQRMISNSELAEKVVYDGHLYGIHKKEIERVLDKNEHIYIIVNRDGYEQIKSIYPDAIGIFLYMSKEDCMANMLLRGDKFEKAIQRISTYEDEMEDRYDYDYVIKNVRHKFYEINMMLINIINQHSKRR